MTSAKPQRIEITLAPLACEDATFEAIPKIEALTIPPAGYKWVKTAYDSWLPEFAAAENFEERSEVYLASSAEIAGNAFYAVISKSISYADYNWGERIRPDNTYIVAARTGKYLCLTSEDFTEELRAINKSGDLHDLIDRLRDCEDILIYPYGAHLLVTCEQGTMMFDTESLRLLAVTRAACAVPDPTAPWPSCMAVSGVSFCESIVRLGADLEEVAARTIPANHYGMSTASPRISSVFNIAVAPSGAVVLLTLKLYRERVKLWIFSPDLLSANFAIIKRNPSESLELIGVDGRLLLLGVAEPINNGTFDPPHWEVTLTERPTNLN